MLYYFSCLKGGKMLDLLQQFVTALTNVSIGLFEFGAIFAISYLVVKGVLSLSETIKEKLIK
jgi:hypothetical protein